MRKLIIIGNWKMNKNADETIDFLKKINKKINNFQIDIGISVPFVNLFIAKQYAKNIVVIAQNCHFEDYGSFTGEISAEMLKNINITHVLLGHSECRKNFNETDKIINKKINTVLLKKMIPIICCGENWKEYQNNQTIPFIKKQIERLLKNINIKYVKNIIIAYEPIWAIGTNKTLNIKNIQNICNAIRTKISELYNSEIANCIKIQYGGNVQKENIKELLSQLDIDGVLVGRSSLDVDVFLQLIN